MDKKVPWTKFRVDGFSSDQILAQLNLLAEQGYRTPEFAVECADGNFVFLARFIE